MVLCHTAISFALASFLLVSDTDCWVYQISPTPSYPYPAQSCLTLPQFTANTSSYLHSNTVLVFLPGKHDIDSKLSIHDIASLHMLQSSNTMSAKIFCQQMSSIDLYNTTTVYISRLEFIGCGGNRVESIGHLLIEDTSFHGHDDSGTALELVKTTAVIEKSSFKSNMGSSLKVTSKGQWRYSAQSSRAGGAIVVTISCVTVTGSIFEENRAEVGGAIFGELNSNIAIIDSIFVGNHVTSHNTDSHCYGGAVYTQSGCTVLVINSTFNNNTAIKETNGYAIYAGGALFATDNYNGATVDINGCKFKFNKANQNGGAVYIKSSIINRS